ncbi:MAG: hypothetical protein K8T91_02265 [Planctomycetes bacterium]|nr:hypothetical protein [Planctomycetota bacterium]
MFLFSFTNRDTDAKRNCRWLQFSTRTLLIVTTLIAIGIAWWSYKARRQREVISEIKTVGGIFHYDYEKNGIYRRSPSYQWLTDHFGSDYFANVSVVWLSETPITDTQLEQLTVLTALKSLGLADTKITDTGLQHIKSFVMIEVLNFSNTQITDAGIENLQRLSQLKSLTLDDTKVTDNGLKFLNRLTGLKDLSLNNTQVTDVGLAHLNELTSLRYLALGGTQITDAGIEHLKHMTTIQILTLTDTRVTNLGIAELKKALPNCEINCRRKPLRRSSPSP